MEHRSVMVRAEWDPEARVYVATSPDVPGLVAEAGNLETLEAKVAGLIPELLELNGIERPSTDVPLFLVAQHVSMIRVPAE